MLSEAQKRAVKKYQAANYEFIKVRVTKGDKDRIKAEAQREGKSINGYILDRLGITNNVPMNTI